MKLRGWGNAFAAAGLLLSVGIAVGQAPAASPRCWISLGIAVTVVVIAIALLRPRGEDLEVETSRSFTPELKR